MVESWILSRRCWICSEESPQSPFLGKAPMKMSGRRGGKTNKLISRSPHRSNVPQLSIVAQLFHRGESNCIFSYSICCPPPHSAGYPIAESYDRKDFQRGAQNPDLPFGEAVYFFVPLWVVQLYTLSLLYQFYTASSSALCLSFVTSFMGLK